MYCPQCGNSISDDSIYCLNCGHHVAGQPAAQSEVEWIYRDIALNYPPKMHGWVRADAYPEPMARQHFWQQEQTDLLEMVQILHDDGWEPVSEIGPSCIQLQHYKSHEGKSSFWTLAEIVFTGGIALLFLPFTGTWKYQMIGFQARFRNPRPITDQTLPSHEAINLYYNPTDGDFIESPNPKYYKKPTSCIKRFGIFLLIWFIVSICVVIFISQGFQK